MDPIYEDMTNNLSTLQGCELDMVKCINMNEANEKKRQICGFTRDYQTTKKQHLSACDSINTTGFMVKAHDTHQSVSQSLIPVS